MLDVGRLCVKIAGREAGKVCCIVKKLDQNFVLVTGPREVTLVKRRKCNIAHLEPLQETIAISPDASDADVLKAYEEAGLLQKLGLRLPSKEEAQKHEELRAEKGKAKKEREEKTRKEREELEKKRKEQEQKKEAEGKKREEEKLKGKKKEKVKPEEKKEQKIAEEKKAPEKGAKQPEPAALGKDAKKEPIPAQPAAEEKPAEAK